MWRIQILNLESWRWHRWRRNANHHCHRGTLLCFPSGTIAPTMDLGWVPGPGWRAETDETSTSSTIELNRGVRHWMNAEQGKMQQPISKMKRRGRNTRFFIRLSRDWVDSPSWPMTTSRRRMVPSTVPSLKNGNWLGPRSDQSNQDRWRSCTMFLVLMKLIWWSEQIPSTWKKAVIMPIFKKGDNCGASRISSSLRLLHPDLLYLPADGGENPLHQAHGLHWLQISKTQLNMKVCSRFTEITIVFTVFVNVPSRDDDLCFLFWRLKKVDNEQSETWSVWVCTELFRIIFNHWEHVAGDCVRIWGNLAELSLVIWYYSNVKNESKRVNEAPEAHSWTHSLSLSIQESYQRLGI